MGIDALYVMVFAGLFSPGPNVILLLASGVRFGFWRTLPHVLGIAAGVGITAGITGYGLGALLQTVPALNYTLKIISASWIFWMAFKLYSSARLAPVKGKDKPFSFIEAVLFQWINPKVWAVAFAATAFTSTYDPQDAALKLAIAFSTVNLGVCLFYAILGHLLAPLMARRLVWRIFMGFLSGLLVFSGFLVLLFNPV